MTLERIDVDGDYTPANCRWIPAKEQPKNTSRIIWFDVDGKKMSMKDACAMLGVSYTMVRLRIWRLGWDREKALMTPPTGAGRSPKSIG